MSEDTNLLIDGSRNYSIYQRRRELVAVLVACIAPLSGGMAHGYSSPAIPMLEKSVSEGGLNLSTDQTSWFAASLTIGAVLGGPITSAILDRLGRKLTLMISALPLTAGWLLVVSASTSTIWLLHLGRAIIGVGIGMGSAAAPVYIAEVASKELRGLLGSFFQTCMIFGVLFTFLLGILLNYTWLAIVSSIVACFLPLAMLLVPETPRWLISVGHQYLAEKAFMWLRNYENETEAHSSFTALKANMNADEGEEFTIKQVCTTKGIRKAITLSVLLMLFQQFGGMNALAFYAEPVFIEAGFGSFAGIMAVILAVIITLGTFASSFFLDKYGRKKMLVFSGLVMIIGCVAFGGYWLLIHRKLAEKSEWYMKTFALVSLTLYVAGFSAGWGSAPWVVMSEILPNKARGLGSSMATSANWTCAFIVVKGFRFLQDISKAGTFFLFAIINFIAIVFVCAFIPETKGKSLEQIQHELCGTNELRQPVETK